MTTTATSHSTRDWVILVGAVLASVVTLFTMFGLILAAVVVAFAVYRLRQAPTRGSVAILVSSLAVIAITITVMLVGTLSLIPVDSSPTVVLEQG